MISFLISAIKIIFLLGFLIGIHETGHFLIAKLCKVRVNEFAIGFGPVIWKKQGKETKYELRLIPLGGFVNMEGEAEQSEKEGSFTKASIPRRIAIVAAGALVNIIFAIMVYFILAMTIRGNLTNAVVGNRVLDADNFGNRLYFASYNTKEFMLSIVESVKQLFTGKVSSAELVGPVGISEVVAKTNGFREFIYILALRTNFNLDILLCRTSMDNITASASNCCFLILWVNSFSHLTSSFQTKIMTHRSPSFQFRQ